MGKIKHLKKFYYISMGLTHKANGKRHHLKGIAQNAKPRKKREVESGIYFPSLKEVLFDS